LTNNKETFYAYIAGLVDGEGYLGMTRHSDKRCMKGQTFDVLLDISNISKPLLVRVAFFLGYGHIYRGQKPRSENHRQVYHLRFYSNTLRILLPRIVDHLILKQDKARELIIELERIKSVGRLTKRDREIIKKLENVEEEIGVSVPDRENVADMKEVVDQLEAEGIKR